jgi:hypothetical protein
MSRTRTTRRTILKTAGAIGALAALAPSDALASESGARYRWDIVDIFKGCPDAPPPAATAGGKSSARTWTGQRITLTGSGTFRDSRSLHRNVTGGGTWETFNASGTSTGRGTYRVTGFVSWTLAAGTLPIGDCIGRKEDARPGLVGLRVQYSDGMVGTLDVSCRLAGSPGDMAEGVSVSKGTILYDDDEEPAAGVDGNRTLFHVLHRGDQGDREDEDRDEND